MAHVTPQFNIKTGSDSQLFFSREVTGNVANTGKIKGFEAEASDVFVYPQLTRRTGHSIAGTTESIESQELRKGRTKSAPRKGNSSSEGSLDIELSPETYDDIFEAALRNKWKPWTSDANSAIKFDFQEAILADQFISNGTSADGGLHAKYLVGVKGDSKNAIVEFESAEEKAKYEIDELTCGTEDIKYSALAQYGGITGEDLYQEFQHLAVNTMSLSVSPGQIVTGSFGFMGSNNPDLLQEGDGCVVANPQPADATAFAAGVFYTYNAGTKVYTKATTYDSATATANGYYVAPTGIVKALVGDDPNGTADNARFATAKSASEVKAWVADLANKVGTDTDQFTAREGFLYINGHRVQYGSNLTFELNNGLKQIFAIFEKGSISTAPMSLDITGTLDAYLIAGHSEDLYNMCSGDKDVEITFCFQDKEDNPDYLYVMQIFKAKFTNNDISQGTEELTVSLPFQSFEERACRFFRIRRKDRAAELKSKIREIELDASGSEYTIKVDMYKTDLSAVIGDFDVAVTVDGTDSTVTPGTYASGVASFTITKPTTGDHEVIVTAKVNGVTMTKKFDINVA